MTCISTQALMKVSADLIEQFEQEQSGGNASGKEQYLRYSEKTFSKAEFALLETDPLEYWHVWGRAVGEGQKDKVFRFLEQPSMQEVELELGENFTPSTKYDSTEIESPKKTLTWPVYNWTEKKVQVLEATHITVIKSFLKYGLNRKYARNLLSWDFELSRVVSDRVRYDLMIVPRDEEEHSEEEMDAAWNAVTKKGFDLKMLITGGDPFSPA